MAFFRKDYDRPLWGGRYPDHRAYRAQRNARPQNDSGAGYDSGYASNGFGMDRGDDRGIRERYDRNVKSRWQTDRGDPFSDRARGTPFRIMRRPFESGDRGPDRWRAYDRGNYRSFPDRGRYDLGWWW